MKNSSLAQWSFSVAKLVRAPARKAGDPGSNPGPGENFSLKINKNYLYFQTSPLSIQKNWLKFNLCRPFLSYVTSSAGFISY